MKKLIILYLLLAACYNIHAQSIQKPSLEIGLSKHSNFLNIDHYLDYKYDYGHDDNLVGLNIKLSFPTKIEYIDFIIGSIIEIQDVNRRFSWNYGSTSSYDYLLNGGGVYAGISPKIRGKYFGITSEFAIGVFSYKEYTGIFNNLYEPYVDQYIRKASGGLGAMSSVGFYFQLGKLRFNPNINAIFSGGSETSFLFYGFNLPLSYQF